MGEVGVEPTVSKGMSPCEIMWLKDSTTLIHFRFSTLLKMATKKGLEPLYSLSKSDVLPLDDFVILMADKIGLEPI